MKEKAKILPELRYLEPGKAERQDRGTVGRSLESSLQEPALIPTELPEVEDL